jgi:hypothetical protein
MMRTEEPDPGSCVHSCLASCHSAGLCADLSMTLGSV